MKKNKSVYLTSQDVAKELMLTVFHVRRLLIQGRIKAIKFGRDWLIDKEDLKGITRRRYPRKRNKGIKKNGDN